LVCAFFLIIAKLYKFYFLIKKKYTIGIIYYLSMIIMGFLAFIVTYIDPTDDIVVKEKLSL